MDSVGERDGMVLLQGRATLVIPLLCAMWVVSGRSKQGTRIGDISVDDVWVIGLQWPQCRWII